jgi:hypothetical protein
VKTPAKALIAVVVLALLGFGGFRVFEHFEQGEVKKLAKRACGTLDTPTGSPTVPAGLTLGPGEKLLRVQTQGKTTAVYVSTAGAIGDVVKVRDAVLASLASQGYAKKGSDQEPGVEADGEFGAKGAITGGTIKVKPLCTNRLEVRYKLNG